MFRISKTVYFQLWVPYISEYICHIFYSAIIGFKGTVGNRALPSFRGCSFEITLLLAVYYNI